MTGAQLALPSCSVLQGVLRAWNHAPQKAISRTGMPPNGRPESANNPPICREILSIHGLNVAISQDNRLEVAPGNTIDSLCDCSFGWLRYLAISTRYPIS